MGPQRSAGGPAITIDFDDVAFATRNFLVVKVPRSSIVHSDNRRRFPVRIGNTTDYLDSVGLSVLLRERGQVPHEQAQQVAAKAEREGHPIPGDELSLFLRTLKDGGAARLEALRDFWALARQYVLLDREDVASAVESVLTSGSEEEKESTLDALRAIHQVGTAAEKETLWRWRDILKHIAMSSPRTQTASKAFFILVLLMDELVIEVLMYWITRIEESTYRNLQPLAYLSGVSLSPEFKRSIREAMYALLSKDKGDDVSRRVPELLEAIRWR